jgi:hypothetical protein
MRKKNVAETQKKDLPTPGKRFPGVHARSWTGPDKTELWWTVQTAHILRESDLSDWKTRDCKQLKLYAENEIGWPE